MDKITALPCLLQDVSLAPICIRQYMLYGPWFHPNRGNGGGGSGGGTFCGRTGT